MSENNNTTNIKEKQYRHLRKDDRIKIESLINQKDENGKRIFNNTYIANYLGVDKSTISRELNKRRREKMYIRTGKTKTMPYTAEYAQNDADFKRGLSKGEYKLRKYKKMTKFIEDKIKIDKWAPDVIVGYMKTHNMFNYEGYTTITTPTIYNAIRYHIINVKLEDTRRMKYKSQYNYHKNDLPESKAEYSINNRPEDIDKRLYFGHFELDTVIGKRNGKHECLMTLTERKTRFEIIFKLKGKTAEEVVNKFNKMKEFMKKYLNQLLRIMVLSFLIF